MKLLISKETKCKTFHRPPKEGAHHQGLPKVTKIGSILVFMVPKGTQNPTRGERQSSNQSQTLEHTTVTCLQDMLVRW